MRAEELQQRIDETPEGGTLQLPPETVRGPIRIDRALTLVGAGADASWLDAEGEGPVITVGASAGAVALSGATLTGGRGGALRLEGAARVRLEACELVDNETGNGRGGVARLDGGALHCVQCNLHRNRAVEAGAIHVGGNAQLVLDGCRLAQNAAERGGALVVTDSARVRLVRTRFDENQAYERGHHLLARGASDRRPSIALVDCVFGEVSFDGPRVVNDPDFAASLDIQNTAWPDDSKKSAPRRGRRHLLH